MSITSEIDKRARVLTNDNFEAVVRHVKNDASPFYTKEHFKNNSIVKPHP